MAHNIFSAAYSAGAKYANRVLEEIDQTKGELSGQDLEDFLAGFRAVVDIGVIERIRPGR